MLHPKSIVQDVKKRQFPDAPTQTGHALNKAGTNLEQVGRPLAYNKSIDEFITS